MKDDTISRQAVIDLLKQMRKDGDMVPWEGKDVFARIRKLPSAWPETHDKRTETHACDLISRQAAIDATWFEPSYTDPLNVLTEVRDRLKDLPSAQPERQKGEWITSDDMYETGVCSVCKCDSQEPVSYAITMFKYCPNCGADMRKDEQE